MNLSFYQSHIYWEKTEQNQAKILRIFGTSPDVTVPSYIEEYPVTELADYCFAADCHLPGRYFITRIEKEAGDTAYRYTRLDAGTHKSSISPVLAELSGSYPESVKLPDTLTTMGSYAFFNCRNLSCIETGKSLETIGSDAFMNCYQLHQLHLRCSVREKTGLQRILNQIPWEIEVSFLGNHSDSRQKEAVVFYPEYYELYDEIAPAHIFGRTIAGEGFRARKSFREGVIDFPQYDRIFQKCCLEESARTVCLLSFYRLYYPTDLSLDNRTQYEAFILAHGTILCQYLIQNRQLEELSFLFRNQLLSLETVQDTSALAARAGWSEGSASILRWKQQFYKTKKRTRYEF